MDTAKAIAVEVTHPGTARDYLFFKKQPTTKTLPLIAVTTTSGTGSQVTQVVVIPDAAFVASDRREQANPLIVAQRIR